MDNHAYLRFVLQERKPGQRTDRWLVVGPSSAIGMVHWGRWRKYVFSAWSNTYYDAGRLGEIAEFLSDKTFAHKHQVAVHVG